MERQTAEMKAERFFQLRFPNRDIEIEKAWGYFYEWVHRFTQPDPTIYMDSDSIAAYQIMQTEQPHT